MYCCYDNNNDDVTDACNMYCEACNIWLSNFGQLLFIVITTLRVLIFYYLCFHQFNWIEYLFSIGIGFLYIYIYFYKNFNKELFMYNKKAFLQGYFRYCQILYIYINVQIVPSTASITTLIINHVICFI